MKQFSMESKHLVVKYSLKIGERIIKIQTFIDCRATRIVIVQIDFVCHHQLEGNKSNQSRELEVISGRPIKSGIFTTRARSGI
jgi:hypothetical protein